MLFIICLSLSIILSIIIFYSKIQYESIDNVTPLLNQFRRDALMAKTDIKDAFCIIPIHPDVYKIVRFFMARRFLS